MIPASWAKLSRDKARIHVYRCRIRQNNVIISYMNKILIFQSANVQNDHADIAHAIEAAVDAGTIARTREARNRIPTELATA